MKVYYDAYQSVMDMDKLNEYLDTYNLKEFNNKITKLNQIFTNQDKTR